MASKTTGTPQPPPVPSTPITMAIIGAGNRAAVYASFALHCPEWLRIVAVCDPRPHAATELARAHSIPKDCVFIGGWEKFTGNGKLADAVAICTPDQHHMGPAIACAHLGYHILLEKPMSVRVEECVRIWEAVEEAGVMCAVGHMLRYSPLMVEVKGLIDSGVLGQVVSVQHLDPIGFFHFAHSFVRGNWHREANSSFTLLTKSCHDIDLVSYLIGRPCNNISSFGSLTHFRKENKPKQAGSAKKCAKCPYEPSCPYSAKKIYMASFERGNRGWPVSVVQPNGPIDIENLGKTLKESDYGTCVYELDNDVCDHQVVNMEFEGGTTASITMVAFSENICVPHTKIFGTRGELTCDGHDTIRVYDFLTRSYRLIHPSQRQNESGIQRKLFGVYSHHSGDFELLEAFLYACASGNKSFILSGAKETLDSHLCVFAAEEARRTKRVVQMDEFRSQERTPLKRKPPPPPPGESAQAKEDHDGGCRASSSHCGHC